MKRNVSHDESDAMNKNVPEYGPQVKGRKTIQLSTVIDSVGKYLVLAVCDDGSIWKLDGLYEGTPKWERFATPPKH